MNLKESFRYQNFLESLMRSATYSIQQPEHCLITTKKHLKCKANSEAQDIVETVEHDAFTPNDDVIRFLQWLVEEREKLSIAIGNAKISVGFDIDAAIETNKFRQQISGAIKSMLRNMPSKRVDTGRDYKFNVEGNQTPYFYDIETTTTDAFDRAESKSVMRSMISKADEISAAIDAAMINTQVYYMPTYDVNESFEDVMAEFVASK